MADPGTQATWLGAWFAWSAEHVGLVLGLALAVSLLTLLGTTAYRVALALAQLRAWWRGGSWLGGAWAPRHPGGAGGRREYSALYDRVMGSAGWRRRTRAVRHRQGGRCAVPGCTRRIDHVHHAEGYARLGRERLDELLGVCEIHHRQLHGRAS